MYTIKNIFKSEVKVIENLINYSVIQKYWEEKIQDKLLVIFKGTYLFLET